MRRRILFLSIAWIVVLAPFLLWRGTWFGRPLSDQQIGNYLHSHSSRQVLHALQQVGDRMSRKDATVSNWYPDLVSLASFDDEDVRTTDAWAMGFDPTHPEFHEVLRHLLHDESPDVRNRAALSLVRCDDASGHDQIVSMLEPTVIKTPRAGLVVNIVKTGNTVREHATVAKLKTESGPMEITVPLAGWIRSVSVEDGQFVTAGAELLTINPGTEQTWDALRALYEIGRPEDLPAIARYLRRTPQVPERVRQQAELTDKAIRERAVR